MRWCFVSAMICFLSTTSCVGAAIAQDLAPTPDEMAANERALDLADQGDVDGGIAILQEAAANRSLNILWLNLGRLQQKAGLCPAAIDSLTQALTAPAVVEPPRDVVREAATKFLSELVAQCPAVVHVSCDPAGLAVSATNGSEAVEGTCGADLRLPGGTWEISGEAEELRTAQELEVRAGQTYAITLRVERPSVEPPPQSGAVAAELVTPVAAPPPKRRSKLDVALLSTAGGVLALAVIADGAIPGFPVSAHNSRRDAFDWVPVGMYVLTAGLVVWAIAVWGD